VLYKVLQSLYLSIFGGDSDISCLTKTYIFCKRTCGCWCWAWYVSWCLTACFVAAGNEPIFKFGNEACLKTNTPAWSNNAEIIFSHDILIFDAQFCQSNAKIIFCHDILNILCPVLSPCYLLLQKHLFIRLSTNFCHWWSGKSHFDSRSEKQGISASFSTNILFEECSEKIRIRLTANMPAF